MTRTKEFYELMEIFEKISKDLFYGHKVARENIKEVPAGHFYTDGYVNDMFQAFLHGYQYHKSISNLTD
jgi:hypothetical protein